MIKEVLDKKFGPSWHVVVGEGFGFELSYEVFTHTVCRSLFSDREK